MDYKQYIQNYTLQNFEQYYANELFNVGHILILNYEIWDKDNTYNKNDRVIYNDPQKSYLSSLHQSLIDDNLNNLPSDVEKWEKLNFDLSNYLLKTQIEPIFSILKNAVLNKTPIGNVYRKLCSNAKTEEELAYFFNIIFSLVLFNIKNGITYQMSNSESLDGASFSGIIPNSMQSLQYAGKLNNPFALLLLSLLQSLTYLDVKIVNNTERDFYLADV